MSGFKNILFKIADPLNLFKLGGEPGPAPPAPTPPVPAREDPAVVQAAADEAARSRRMRGRSASLLYGASAPDPATRGSGASLLGQ